SFTPFLPPPPPRVTHYNVHAHSSHSFFFSIASCRACAYWRTSADFYTFTARPPGRVNQLKDGGKE
ncbi:MAG: hypothetical protein LBK73_05270, partial [Treponema sp.]|nr:hypothetical protein [Treponema sp.]